VFGGAQGEGVGLYQVTQRNGERWSAARAYVHPHLSRPNLQVITGARASASTAVSWNAVPAATSRMPVAHSSTHTCDTRIAPWRTM